MFLRAIFALMMALTPSVVCTAQTADESVPASSDGWLALRTNLLYDAAILPGSIDQEDQTLSLAIGTERIAASDTYAHTFNEPLRETVQHAALFHGIALAVQDRAQHQVGGSAHSVKESAV